MRKFDRDVLIESYKKHHSCQKAAEECGCHFNTVYRAIKKAGVDCDGWKYNSGNQKRKKITDEQILEAVKTMTRQEIADLYGVHVENLARRMKKLGVHAVYAVPEKKKCAAEWHWTQGCADMVERCQNGRYELVEFKGGRVRIRCKKCGAIVERSQSTIRQKNVVCDGCEQHEEEKQAEKQAREAFVKTLAKIAEYQKEKICPVCGRVFHSYIPHQKYCSHACKHKAKGHMRSYKSRTKKYGVYYDPSVTREAVIKRDNMVCQICGKVCDPNDKSWGNSGPDYPTLDHIIPLAKGGSHTWGNVQCACGICNSTKRDLITA